MKTNLMHYLTLIYFITQPLHVSGVFIAQRQEVFTVYVQQLVRVIHLGDWQLVGSDAQPCINSPGNTTHTTETRRRELSILNSLGIGLPVFTLPLKISTSWNVALLWFRRKPCELTSSMEQSPY
jgi:hypothetical protein